MDLILANGRVAVVDPEDYAAVRRLKWWQAGPYVITRTGGETVYLHRRILGLKKGDRRHGDHCNRNPLDNRRCNLRIVSPSVNFHNRRVAKNNTSGHTGVYSDGQKYRTVGHADGKKKHLGTFRTLDEAVSARRRFDEAFDPRTDCRCTTTQGGAI